MEEAHIQQTNPALDVLMCHLQEKLSSFLEKNIHEICQDVGIKAGIITSTSRAASLGETDELMFVILIKATNLTVAGFEEPLQNEEKPIL